MHSYYVVVKVHTSGNDVIDNENLLALTDSILLHLEEILAVLLDVFGGDARTGELALLANGGKRDTKAESKAGSKEETTGIKTNNHIRLVVTKGLLDLKLEGRYKSSVGFGVGEERHDIDKDDSGDGKVLERAQVLAQSYLSTGELGGGGGGGGGLSSRGIVRSRVGGGICRSAHGD